jgi:hypothetical protein
MKDLYNLPNNLPIPEDDGVCDPLLGSSLPSVELESTSSEMVDLSCVGGVVVIFTSNDRLE